MMLTSEDIHLMPFEGQGCPSAEFDLGPSSGSVLFSVVDPSPVLWPCRQWASVFSSGFSGA